MQKQIKNRMPLIIAPVKIKILILNIYLKYIQNSYPENYKMLMIEAKGLHQWHCIHELEDAISYRCHCSSNCYIQIECNSD